VAVTAAGLDPDQQAMGYAAATHGDLGPDYAATARTYREHLRALGIAGTVHVLLDVHRPPEGQPLFVAAVEARGRLYDASALAELRAGLALASADTTTLLAARVLPSSHAWLVQERSLREPERTQYRVRFEGGRARDQELSEAAGVLVELLARGSPLRDTVQEYARACNGTPDQIQNAVLDFVRNALVSGLLVPAEG
jgi:hypothetical protein